MDIQNALIIFVRNPILGKVKTRLAATMGDENALAVYKYLLLHTKNITQKISVAKFIFYADEINENDLWNGYEKRLQAGNNLGEKMANAFIVLFEEGYNIISIIGSDCYQLSTEILAEAFKKLKIIETVIGPAIDGGYYLLGMQAPFKNLFDNIIWSSNEVCGNTKAIIKKNNLSLYLLPILNDVDEEKDVTFAY